MKTIKIENIGGIDIIWQLCLNPQCIIITELCLPLLFMQQKLIKIVKDKFLLCLSFQNLLLSLIFFAIIFIFVY